MHKNATKYNETLSKWCKNKHGASKIIDTFETYQPSTLFLGGWPTTTVPLYAGTAKAGLLPVGVAWTVRGLLSLSSCSARKCTELTWVWSVPSQETAREEVFWSLAVLAVVLLMRRLPMRVFSARLRSSVYPWAEAGPFKEPRSRWTEISRYPEH
jgi:hypothetical protein